MRDSGLMFRTGLDAEWRPEGVLYPPAENIPHTQALQARITLARAIYADTAIILCVGPVSLSNAFFDTGFQTGRRACCFGVTYPLISLSTHSDV